MDWKVSTELDNQEAINDLDNSRFNQMMKQKSNFTKLILLWRERLQRWRMLSRMAKMEQETQGSE